MDPEIRKVLEFTQSLLTYGENDRGCCMCGSPVEGHGFGDGHSPVDAYDYHAARLLEDIGRLLGD